jgi:DNA-directed RNA polymerase subunit M/transcription elongation factor TFIIS
MTADFANLYIPKLNELIHIATGAENLPLATALSHACFENVKKVAIERNLEFAKTVEFCSLYELKFSALIALMDDRVVVANLVSGALDVRDIFTKPIYEICRHLSHLDKYRITPDTDVVIENTYSKRYTCRNCGHKESIIKQQQRRSADEAVSLKVTCVKCESSFVLS